MSEREFSKKDVVAIVLFLGVVGLSCILWCGKLGRIQGRAEMKRWQDDYYAAHPVVKEVPIVERVYTLNDAVNVKAGWTYKNIRIDAEKKPLPDFANLKSNAHQQAEQP